MTIDIVRPSVLMPDCPQGILFQLGLPGPGLYAPQRRHPVGQDQTCATVSAVWPIDRIEEATTAVKAAEVTRAVFDHDR